MQINNISDREAMFFLSSLSELGYASKRAIYENIKPLYSIFEMNFENLKMKVKLREKQIRAVLGLKIKLNELHEKYLSLDERKIKFILPFEDEYP